MIIKEDTRVREKKEAEKHGLPLKSYSNRFSNELVLAVCWMFVVCWMLSVFKWHFNGNRDWNSLLVSIISESNKLIAFLQLPAAKITFGHDSTLKFKWHIAVSCKFSFK